MSLVPRNFCAALLAPLTCAAVFSGCFVHVIGEDTENPANGGQAQRPNVTPRTPPQTAPQATPASAQAKPAPKRSITARAFFKHHDKNKQAKKPSGATTQLPEAIYFSKGKSELLPESDAALQQLHAHLVATPDITKLRIEGHTSTEGADAANQTLSKLRAMAVAQYLRGKGIDCKRLVAVGFGGTKPKVTPEKTEDDKAANNRVAFHTAERAGKAVDGQPLDGGGASAGDPCAGG